MAYLSYISDENLLTHIRSTLTAYRETLRRIDLSAFNSNIIDPIKLTFDSIVYGKEIETIINEEIVRQRDKTNTNAIGYFHQNLFAYLDNCEIPRVGFDIVYSGENTVYVELKNKHNTMNSSSSQKTYTRMLNKIANEAECECYLVEVMARRSQNIVWRVSLDSEPMQNERIRRVSIDKFYEIVTGQRDAFFNLCRVLPQVIERVVNETLADEREEDTVIEELRRENQNLLKALYLLAFRTYEGFDAF